MKNKQSVKVFILIAFVILLFLKIDYRFKLDWECCTDEFDYYAHAKTIALDFDLDRFLRFGPLGGAVRHRRMRLRLPKQIRTRFHG